MASTIPAAAGAQQATHTSTPLVFDGVTVVDVEQGKLVPNQRIVIVGNRIQTMGAAGSVKTPTGAQVVDARGKYLIPGLWDLHTHSMRSATDVFYPLFLANGVTGIRDAWSPVPLDTLIQWRREILAGARIGPPRQILSGPMIQSYCPRGDKGCVPLDPDVDSVQLAANARHLVDSLRSAGADMIKMRDLFPATTYLVIAGQARRAGMPFGGHAWDSIDVAASDSGASIIDHARPWYDVITGFRGHCWRGRGPASVELCRPMAERFKRNHTWALPALIMEQVAGQGIAETEQAQAIFDRSSAHLKQFWDGILLQGNWLRDFTHIMAAPGAGADSLGTLRIMERVGFPIVAGTDANTDVVPGSMQAAPPGFGLHTELAMDVAEGLTPLTALQSATLNPAQMWHATDSLGTVAAGKLADLVLLDANPLADITNTTTIRAVVANGRYFDRAALDSLLREVLAKAKEP